MRSNASTTTSRSQRSHRRDRVRAPADARDPGAAGAAARPHTTTAWATWLLTAFLLVAAVRRRCSASSATSTARSGCSLISLRIFFVGCVGGDLRLEHLVADRVPRDPGRRRRRLPALASRSSRTSSRAEKVGAAIGHRLVGLRDRRRARPRPLGRDRRPRLVAVAVHRRRGRRSAVAVVLVRRFVPESPIKTPSRARRRPARSLLSGGARRAAARADRGRRTGAGRRGRIVGALRRRRSRSPSPGCSSSCACPSRWSTCACSPSAPCC